MSGFDPNQNNDFAMMHSGPNAAETTVDEAAEAVENDEATETAGDAGSVWDDDLFKSSQSYEELIKEIKLKQQSNGEDASSVKPTTIAECSFDRLFGKSSETNVTLPSLVRCLRLRDDLVNRFMRPEQCAETNESTKQCDQLDSKLKDFLFTRNLTTIKPLKYGESNDQSSHESFNGMMVINTTPIPNMLNKCLELLHNEKLVVRS